MPETAHENYAEILKATVDPLIARNCAEIAAAYLREGTDIACFIIGYDGHVTLIEAKEMYPDAGD